MLVVLQRDSLSDKSLHKPNLLLACSIHIKLTRRERATLWTCAVKFKKPAGLKFDINQGRI